MPHTPVAANLGEPLDVHCNLTAEITLDGVVMVNHFTQGGLLVLGQVLHTGVGIDAGLCQDLLGAGASNAVDIRETNFNSFFAGQVNTSNTCHILQAPPISLVSACVWGSRKLP